jgi:hypothetical protein
MKHPPVTRRVPWLQRVSLCYSFGCDLLKRRRSKWRATTTPVSEGRCIPRFQVYQTSAHKGRLLVWRSVRCDAQGLNARSNAGVKNVSRSFHALREPQQSTRLGPPRNSSCSRSKDGTCPMRLPGLGSARTPTAARNKNDKNVRLTSAKSSIT